jgi:hypothetical protein
MMLLGGVHLNALFGADSIPQFLTPPSFLRRRGIKGVEKMFVNALPTYS